MRRDAIEMLGAVNRWIDLAKGLLAKQAQLPLITDSEIDMHAEIFDVRESGDDDSLRTAVENVLSRDPDDVAPRFVPAATPGRGLQKRWDRSNPGPAGADMADLPGGASGLLCRDYERRR